MYLLFEREVNADIGRLERAWRDPATFAFVGDKCGLPREWIEQKLVRLPAEYLEGHFILLTSGSPGQPKLVVGRHDRAERLSEVLHEVQESEPVSEAICALPLRLRVRAVERSTLVADTNSLTS